MAVTTSQILQGPATIYSGLFGAAEPLDSAIGSVPGAAWTDLGATDDGLEVGIYDGWSNLDVDQLIEHAGVRRTDREMRFGTKLAEATLANLAIALNEPAPTAGTSPAGPTFEPQGGANFIPTYRAFLFDGFAPGGFRRRFIARKCIQTSDAKLNMQKTDKSVIPVEFTAYYVSTTINPWRVVDQIA